MNGVIFRVLFLAGVLGATGCHKEVVQPPISLYGYPKTIFVNPPYRANSVINVTGVPPGKYTPFLTPETKAVPKDGKKRANIDAVTKKHSTAGKNKRKGKETSVAKQQKRWFWNIGKFITGKPVD